MRHRGFTLIELMIVVAIIAVIAAIAIPGLLRSKISSQESSAIGSCKTIGSAQAQFKSNAAVDQDSDGEGEYGYLSEIAGISGLRINGGVSARKFDPPSLPAILGVVGLGSAQKSGYEYRMYLPTAAGPAQPQATQTPPAGAAADAQNQEVRWACYAWPQTNGQSGRRVFLISHLNEIVASNNIGAGQGYTAKSVTPAPEAAFDASGADPANLEAAIARNLTGLSASDGGLWVPAQ